VFDYIKQILVEKFQVEAAAIAPGAVLEDLDLDSLDAVELSLVLEDRYGTRISEEEIIQARTIDDIIHLAESRTGVA
jgi:acyl carrier protein